MLKRNIQECVFIFFDNVILRLQNPEEHFFLDHYSKTSFYENQHSIKFNYAKFYEDENGLFEVEEFDWIPNEIQFQLLKTLEQKYNTESELRNEIYNSSRFLYSDFKHYPKSKLYFSVALKNFKIRYELFLKIIRLLKFETKENFDLMDIVEIIRFDFMSNLPGCRKVILKFVLLFLEENFDIQKLYQTLFFQPSDKNNIIKSDCECISIPNQDMSPNKSKVIPFYVSFKERYKKEAYMCACNIAEISLNNFFKYFYMFHFFHVCDDNGCKLINYGEFSFKYMMPIKINISTFRKVLQNFPLDSFNLTISEFESVVQKYEFADSSTSSVLKKRIIHQLYSKTSIKK